MNIILFDAIPKYISVTDERGIHIRKILKLKAGDSFKAGIIDGPVGEVRILSENHAGYELSWRETGAPVGLYPLTMITGFVRPISAKRILREAASLGVGRLVLTVTDTGERSYLKANLWKTGEYLKYLRNGLQTAGATVMPAVVLCRNVREAVAAALQPADNAARETDEAVARPTGRAPARDTEVPPVGKPVCLLLDNIEGRARVSEIDLAGSRVVYAVGSERGWSDRERKIFLDAGFRPLKMGDRVLRTETACTAATSLILQRIGRM